jgi:sigma-54-interacting transcriptional regulator
MEESSNGVIALESGSGPTRSVLQTGEDLRLAREADGDLQMMGKRRSNLLLEGPAGPIRTALERLWLEPREPILTWSPGQPLDLPPPGRAATMVLHDVSELTYVEQHRLLAWMDQVDGRIRVVSTTAVPLWPRVNAGAFNDVLYYRLNTVCVDVGR